MLINALNGLVYGSLLFVLSAGLVLIYGLRRVVNFAHGAFYTVGAYAGVFVFGLTGNFWLGLVAVPLIKPLFQSREGLSDAIDRLCFAGTVECSNQAEAQVLAHRQARDDAPVLRHVAEPAMKADMRSFAENLLAAEHDAAGALGDQPKPQIP